MPISFSSTNPSDKAKKIKIVGTDANGKSYKQSFENLVNGRMESGPD